MKVAVINGSPSGENSLTLRYVNYLENKFKTDSFEKLNVFSIAEKLEQDSDFYSQTVKNLSQTDLILWSFPVYYMLVPACLKKFIEILNKNSAEKLLAGKYTAVITTSIHYCDNIAHDYIRGICEDLGMNYVDRISANMKDLLNADFLKHFDFFYENASKIVAEKRPVQKMFSRISENKLVYTPGSQTEIINTTKKALLITDAEAGSSIEKMIERVKAKIQNLQVINLNDIKIARGCVGCFKCTFTNRCCIRETDDVESIYEGQFKAADIIIYAGELKDRWFSSRMKMFMDRGFMYNHKPIHKGKQIGVIISGNASECEVFRNYWQPTAQFGQGNYAGIVSDEAADSAQLDMLLDNFASDIVSKAENSYIAPCTFEGVGGKKIFRDVIYGNLRFLFQEDHRYYRQNGMYDDFPQKDIHSKIQYLIIWLITRRPKVKKGFGNQARARMLQPYDAYLKELFTEEKK